MRKLRKAPRVIITLAIATVALGAMVASPAIGGPSLNKLVKKAVKKEVKKQLPNSVAGPAGQQGLAGAAGAAATALFAGVNADGTMHTQKGVVGAVAHTAGTGAYTVTFDRNVDACVPIASLSHDDPGTVLATTLGGANNTVAVNTQVSDSAADDAFNVAVLC